MVVGTKHLSLYARKGMNDKMGSNGIVPLLLRFGAFSNFLISNKKLPRQNKGMSALDTASEGAENIRAEQEISKEIKSNTPPSVRYKLKSGNNVYAFSKIIGKCISGQKIVDIGRKMILVNNRARIIKLNISQLLLQ